MFKLSDLLSGRKRGVEVTNLDPSKPNANPVSTVRNWYEERYDTLIVQRNILMALLGVSLVIVVVSILAIAKIATSKEFDPFVVQVDEQTGEAKVVNPITSEILDGNEALNRYFIKRYVTARETYNPVDFESYARKTVRLLSSKIVFQNFLGYIKNKDNDPILLYAQKNTTFLTIRSWSKLDKKKYIVRFSISETAGAAHVFNKIAIVDIDYVATQLSDDERDINPVGFQVIGYKVDNDNS